MLSPTDPSPTRLAPPVFLSGLSEVAERYDVLFCDVWGVLHDSIVSFRPARDALSRFRAKGGTVVLVSNAPRPGHVVEDQLDRLGVGRDAYDAIVTSGDLTRKIVTERLGQVVFNIGPERDRPIYDGLPVRFGAVDAADYAVCTGLVDDDAETPSDYAGLLRTMRSRDLWMLCANPDIVVERGSTLVYCAGALAAAYEEIGGTAYYPGKPHAPIYVEALATAERLRGASVPKSRVLAVGDSMRTDIAGALAFGVDALMVARGIHAAELELNGGPLDPDRTHAWLAGQTASPTAIATELSWV